MYWPSTSADGEFVFRDIEGEFLNPDQVLARYKDWRDSSEWPVSSRQHVVVQREMKKQADPLEKDGVIGAFCRTYCIEERLPLFCRRCTSQVPCREDLIISLRIPRRAWWSMRGSFPIPTMPRIRPVGS